MLSSNSAIDAHKVIKMQFAETKTRTHAPRVLILGGTTEASELAAHLAPRSDVTVISSLAGRVSQPRLPAGIVREGGFGGVAGLISYLVAEDIRVVIDATHPFASKISGNAELACNTLGLPLIALDRPAWEPIEHDCWHRVSDTHAAASMVNHQRNRVFLSIGRQELGAFSNCEDAWFLVRAIDAPTEMLPANSKLILKRGPFLLNDELQMLRSESISVIVSKNSGGTASYAKIEAARTLRIPIVMIDRPRKHNVPTVPQPNDVLHKLAQLL
jgi:precorrin-6A/cobalt-precorrin-6A reductase